MKSVCFFVILMMFAFCSTKLSSYDGLVQQMVLLNQKVSGNNSAVVDVAKATDAASQAKSAIEKALGEVDANCKAGQDAVKGVVKDIKSDITASKGALADAKVEKKKAEGEFKSKAKSLGESKKKLAGLYKDKKKLFADTQKHEGECQQKVIIIEQLESIARDELLNPAPAKKSFIQTSSKFNDKFAQLKESIINKSKDIEMSPLLEALAELTVDTSHFSNQKILNKILKCLEKIRQKTQKACQCIKDDYSKNLDGIVTQCGNVEEEISQYTKLVAQAQSDIRIAVQAIHHIGLNIARLNGKVKRFSYELKGWDAACSRGENYRKKAIAAITGITNQLGAVDRDIVA